MNRTIQLGFLAIAGLALVGAGVSASSGCTVLTNDALPDDATVYEGGGDGGSLACTSCVADQCTATWATCLLDERCRAMHACAKADGCGADCRTACACSALAADGGGDDAGVSPEGAFRAFTSCNDARTCAACSADCSATCASGSPSTTPGACGEADAAVDAGEADAAAVDGGLDAGDDAGDAASPPAGPSVDGCASCAAGKCADAKKACAIGTECAAFLACVFACGDEACATACAEQHATGEVAATELATCTTSGCRQECGY